MTGLTCLELCAGGGGQAIGLERAGFTPRSLIEIDPDCCATLRHNRPEWIVLKGDIASLHGITPGWADLIAGGLPCTPHSRGGKQLGQDDERHLWDAALRLVTEGRPRAVMLETASAIMTPKFTYERALFTSRLMPLGYYINWDVIDCSRFGVPQRRKRAVLVAFAASAAQRAFAWPRGTRSRPPTVGNVLSAMAAASGWVGAEAWSARAQDIAPTVTGGSRKHGGADLGASQGKAAWRRLGIDPMGIADGPPGPDGKYPRGRGIIRDVADRGLMLTTEMAAALQGFPPDWEFSGGKTARYRQVGNAFPPPAAEAIGRAIAAALNTPG